MFSYSTLWFSIRLILLTEFVFLFLIPPVTSFLKHAKRQADKAPLKDTPTAKFLGWVDNRAVFLGKNSVTHHDSWGVCSNIKYNTPGEYSRLISVTSKNLEKVTEVLNSKASDEKTLWVAQWIKRIEGREVMIISHEHGTEEEDVTGQGMMEGTSTRAQREAFLRGKRENDLESNHVNIQNVLYPWIANWTNGVGAGCSATLSTCKPRQCTTVSGDCTIETIDCTVENPKCELVKSGPCVAKCGKCNVTQPRCFQGNSTCVMIEERVCTVEPPECTVDTPECTITRPQCKTQSPSCKFEVTAEDCTMAGKCPATQQGNITNNCAVIPRKCTHDEISAGKKSCSYPQLLCLTPQICKRNKIVCPTGKTFCPPEKVHCPEPQVTCGEPQINCTEPVFNCPKPRVECEQPVVTCDAPAVVCPTTITKCTNPVVKCKKPSVVCPPPVTTCDPVVPCKIDTGNIPCKPTQGRVECGENCECGGLIKKDSGFTLKGQDCERLMKPVCAYTA